MSYINENIDEFFQNAAEDYPLKTSVADWETFSQKLPPISNRGSKFADYRFVVAISACILFIVAPFSLETPLQKVYAEKHNRFENSAAGILANHAAAKGLTENNKNNTRSLSVFAEEYYDVTTQVAEANQPNTVFRSADARVAKLQDKPFAPEIANTENILPPQHDAVTAELLFEANKVETSTKNTIKLNTQSRRRLYIGATLAPEISNVKHQSVTKPGFTGGFLAGYKVNSKLQVEIGMALSHKYYYTKGKYAPPDVIRRGEQPVDNVNAFTSVTEIPLTLQYNFRSSGTSRSFASVGTISSLVHKDRYNFDYNKNGEERSGSRRYNKSADNLFTAIQISAGYERKLGNIGNVRIEPYYRLPLNGIGSANLPVTSIGINFGLTRFIK